MRHRCQNLISQVVLFTDIIQVLKFIALCYWCITKTCIWCKGSGGSSGSGGYEGAGAAGGGVGEEHFSQSYLDYIFFPERSPKLNNLIQETISLVQPVLQCRWRCCWTSRRGRQWSRRSSCRYFLRVDFFGFLVNFCPTGMIKSIFCRHFSEIVLDWKKIWTEDIDQRGAFKIK